MDSNALHYFKTIAEENNITKAAERLFISQQALSKALKHLEDELGSQLFVRSGRKLYITQEGEVLLRYARVVEDTLDEAVEAVRLVAEKNNSFRIAVINEESLGIISMQAVIQEYRTVKIMECREDNVVDLLVRGQADFAIAPDIHLDQYMDKVRKIPVLRSSLFLAVPVGHPLEQKDSITAKELDGVHIMRCNRASFLQKRIDCLLKHYNVKPHVDGVYDAKTMLEMIEKSSMPYFTTTETYLRMDVNFVNQRHKLVKIDEPLAVEDFYLWYLKENEDRFTDIKKYLIYSQNK